MLTNLSFSEQAFSPVGIFPPVFFVFSGRGSGVRHIRHSPVFRIFSPVELYIEVTGITTKKFSGWENRPENLKKLFSSFFD